ncbi:MAG: carbohydrate porin [Pontixanthobacter sp.]
MGLASIPAAAQEAAPDAGAAAVAAPASADQATPPAAAKPQDKTSTSVVWSQFVDAPVSGSARSTLRYGGKIDAYVDVKGSAVGLDDSLSIHFHPEFKYGKSSNGEIGLIPANTLLFYPGDGDVFDLSINVTKRWKSGTSLTVGKINILDLAGHIPVQGGGGHEGFQNLSLALPPSAIVPGSVTGAMLNVPTEKLLFRVLVFDPELQSRRSGLEDPFSKGVGVLASATLPTKIGGKPGFYSLKIAASSRSELAADALPAALVPAPGSPFGHRKGEFSAIFAFEQYLSMDAAHPGKGIGLFGQVYWSNGNPTFLDVSGFIGISGNPRFRPQDRFGINYFRYSLADGLVDALRNRVALQDEEGVEAFYTLGLSDQIRLTANVQIVDSAVTLRDLGVTTGLRLTTTF